MAPQSCKNDAFFPKAWNESFRKTLPTALSISLLRQLKKAFSEKPLLQFHSVLRREIPIKNSSSTLHPANSVEEESAYLLLFFSFLREMQKRE